MRTNALLAAGDAEANAISAKSSDATATSLARSDMVFSCERGPGTGKADLNRLNAAIEGAVLSSGKVFQAGLRARSRLSGCDAVDIRRVVSKNCGRRFLDL